MRFAVFNNQAEYNTWHTGVKASLGLTDANSPYLYTLTHLIDPVTYPQVLARIDSRIDETGLVIWDEQAAMQNGFLDAVPFVKDKLQKRKEFWEKLVDEYSAQNQLAGITTEQTSHVVVKMQFALFYGMVGALPTALATIQAMTPDDFTQPEHWITQAMLDDYVAKIQAFLAEE